MGETSVKSLLRTMTIRHSLHMDGITHPQSSVVNATKQLVEKLAALDPTEAIKIVVLSESSVHAHYIRTKTGDLLAEIQMEDDQNPDH